MTYFGFLAAFILFPILILTIFGIWEERKGKSLNDSKIAIAIGIHMILALLYTTPWDNYLVATGVWFYNPRLVSGIVLGYVPIEEYTFFLLETLFVGLWWQIVARPDNFARSFQAISKITIVISFDRCLDLAWFSIYFSQSLEAHDLSFDHLVLGNTADDSPTGIRSGYSLASTQASCMDDFANGLISFLRGFAGNCIGNLDD